MFKMQRVGIVAVQRNRFVPQNEVELSLLSLIDDLGKMAAQEKMKETNESQ